MSGVKHVWFEEVDEGQAERLIDRFDKNMKVMRCRYCRVPVWDCQTKLPVEVDRLTQGRQYTTEHARSCPQHPDKDTDDDRVELEFA